MIFVWGFLLFKPSLVNAMPAASITDDDLIFVTCNILADGPYVSHGKSKFPLSYIPFADPGVPNSRLNLFMAHFNPPYGLFSGADVICFQEFDNNWNGWTSGIAPHIHGTPFPTSGGYMGYKIFFNGARFRKISEVSISSDMGNMYNCIVTTLQHTKSSKQLVVVNCQWPYPAPANMARIIDLETRLKTRLSTIAGPCIVCGDFNTEGLRTPYDRISASPTPPAPPILWANASTGLPFTSSTTASGPQKIDYVFYDAQKMQLSGLYFFPSNSAQLLNHTQNNQGATFFSDHCIIRAYFKVPEWVSAPPPPPAPAPAAIPVTAAPAAVSVKVPVGTFVPVDGAHYETATDIPFIETAPARLAAEKNRYPLYWLKLDGINDSALVQLRKDVRPGHTGAYDKLGFFPPSAMQSELLWTFALVDPTKFHENTFTYHQHHRMEGTKVLGDYTKYYSKRDRTLKDQIIKLDNYTYYTTPIVLQAPWPEAIGGINRGPLTPISAAVPYGTGHSDWYWLPVPVPVDDSVLVKVLVAGTKPSLKPDTLDEHAGSAKWESNFRYIDTNGDELPSNSNSDWALGALYYWKNTSDVRPASVQSAAWIKDPTGWKSGVRTWPVASQANFQKHPAEGPEKIAGRPSKLSVVKRSDLKNAWQIGVPIPQSHGDGKFVVLQGALRELKDKLGKLSGSLRRLKG